MGNEQSVHIHFDKMDGETASANHYSMRISNKIYDKCNYFKKVTYEITYYVEFPRIARATEFYIYFTKRTWTVVNFTYYPYYLKDVIDEVYCFYSVLRLDEPLVIGFKTRDGRIKYYRYMALDFKTSTGLPSGGFNEDAVLYNLWKENQKLNRKLTFIVGSGKNVYINGIPGDEDPKFTYRGLFKKVFRKANTDSDFKGHRDGPWVLYSNNLFTLNSKKNSINDNFLRPLNGLTFYGIYVYYTASDNIAVLIEMVKDFNDTIFIARRNTEGTFWEKVNVDKSDGTTFDFELERIQREYEWYGKHGPVKPIDYVNPGDADINTCDQKKVGPTKPKETLPDRSPDLSRPVPPGVPKEGKKLIPVEEKPTPTDSRRSQEPPSKVTPSPTPSSHVIPPKPDLKEKEKPTGPIQIPVKEPDHPPQVLTPPKKPEEKVQPPPPKLPPATPPRVPEVPKKREKIEIEIDLSKTTGSDYNSGKMKLSPKEVVFGFFCFFTHTPKHDSADLINFVISSHHKKITIHNYDGSDIKKVEVYFYTRNLIFPLIMKVETSTGVRYYKNLIQSRSGYSVYEDSSISSKLSDTLFAEIYRTNNIVIYQIDKTVASYGTISVKTETEYGFKIYTHSTNDRNIKKAHVYFNGRSVELDNSGIIQSEKLSKIDENNYSDFKVYSITRSTAKEVPVLLQLTLNNKTYYLHRIDDSGVKWKQVYKNIDALKTGFQSFLRFEADFKTILQYFYNLFDKSLIIELNNINTSYKIKLLSNDKLSNGDFKFRSLSSAEILTSSNNMVSVKQMNCSLFLNSNYSDYLHNISNVNTSDFSKRNNINGLRLFMGDNEVNLFTSDGKTRKFIKLSSNVNDVHVYFNKEKNNPILFFYNGEGYSPKDETDYKNNKWRLNKDFSSPDCDQRKNVNLINALNTISYNLDLKRTGISIPDEHESEEDLDLGLELPSPVDTFDRRGHPYPTSQYETYDQHRYSGTYEEEEVEEETTPAESVPAQVGKIAGGVVGTAATVGTGVGVAYTVVPQWFVPVINALV